MIVISSDSEDSDRDDPEKSNSRKPVTKSRSSIHHSKKIKLEPSTLSTVQVPVEAFIQSSKTPAPEKTQKRKGPTHVPAKKDSGHKPIDRRTGTQITRNQWVQHIKTIDNIPTEWDVSKELTAYVIDLTDTETFDMETKSIIQWIRHEVG